MRFAIDVMGGDHAPDAIVRGVVEALEDATDDDRFVLVGDRAVIEEILGEAGASDPRVSIEHAPQIISMSESPVEAIKNKPDSSIVRMMRLGSARKTADPVDAVISAGNTGACVSAANMEMRRLPGVHRPGIAVVLPTPNGPLVMCDVGANPEPRPNHLAQYGVMAEVYARSVLGVSDPRIAQMNIGSEESKGTALVQEVRHLLRDNAHLNYVGFAEGRDLFEGVADVVVTDGFVGNTVLKLAEGLARSLFRAIATEVFEKDPELAMQLQPLLQGLIRQNDYHEYGGAPLLGVNGVCLICHGSSEARTIRSAIRRARLYVRSGVNAAIVERLAELRTEPAS
ncbi:MAG: phosphate acyltransferase PlsX [Planctomycetota bacterium]